MTIQTITGNSGGAVGPFLANINFIGSNGFGLNVVGTPASFRLDMSGIDASTSQKGVFSGDAADFSIAAGALSLTNQSLIVYFGSHGNNANDGVNVESAKLTMVGARAGVGSVATIACLDGDIYGVSPFVLSGYEYVVYMPRAFLSTGIQFDEEARSSIMNISSGVVTFCMYATPASRNISFRCSKADTAGVSHAVCLNLLSRTFFNVISAGANTATSSILYAVNPTGRPSSLIMHSLISNSSRFMYTTNSVAYSRALRIDDTDNSCIVADMTGSPFATLHAMSVNANRAMNYAADAFYMSSACVSGSFTDTSTGKTRLISGTRTDNVSIGPIIPEKGTFNDLKVRLPLSVSGWSNTENRNLQTAVQTTDATVTDLVQIPVSTNQMVTVEARINGLQSTYAKGIGATVKATFRRAGGNVTLVGTPTINTLTDSGSLVVNAIADTTAQEATITVQGIALETYNWVATYSFTYLVDNT